MKSLQQSIVIAFAFALLIVSLHHIGELLGWFVFAAIGFGGSHWAISQYQSLNNQPVEAVEGTPIFPEQVISQLFEEFQAQEEALTGTDLWAETPQSDAVETEPLQPHLEEVADETPADTGLPQKSKSDQFQLLVRQIESLPQKQGRRKVWMALCDRLAVKGAGKVRDASPAQKAKFLESKNVKVPEVIKAKIVALRAA